MLSKSIANLDYKSLATIVYRHELYYTQRLTTEAVKSNNVNLIVIDILCISRLQSSLESQHIMAGQYVYSLNGFTRGFT